MAGTPRMWTATPMNAPVDEALPRKQRSCGPVVCDDAETTGCDVAIWTGIIASAAWTRIDTRPRVENASRFVSLLPAAGCASNPTQTGSLFTNASRGDLDVRMRAGECSNRGANLPYDVRI